MGLDIFHARLTREPQLEYFTEEELAEEPAFLRAHRNLFFNVDDPDRGRTTAAWWKELAHQRNGMRREFYHAFENCKLYFRRADVARAAMFLLPEEPESGADFARNFTEAFVEGESIFMASW